MNRWFESFLDAILGIDEILLEQNRRLSFLFLSIRVTSLIHLA
jgi:hypothetical protein